MLHHLSETHAPFVPQLWSFPPGGAKDSDILLQLYTASSLWKEQKLPTTSGGATHQRVRSARCGIDGLSPAPLTQHRLTVNPGLPADDAFGGNTQAPNYTLSPVRRSDGTSVSLRHVLTSVPPHALTSRTHLTPGRCLMAERPKWLSEAAEEELREPLGGRRLCLRDEVFLERRSHSIPEPSPPPSERNASLHGVVSSDQLEKLASQGQQDRLRLLTACLS